MKPLLDNKQMLAIRRRLLQMHHESGVGHIGGNLSAIDVLSLLFNEYLGAQDAFILSKGHSAGALYVALWSVGKLGDEDLRMFHRDDSLLAGHPPARGIAEIMFATGSLGHGLSLAAGTALAKRLKGENGQTFCLTSDGEWQEGSTWEALIFAAHRRLTNLTILIDHNRLQGFGGTEDVASMCPLQERLKGFDVDVQAVSGHDLDAMRNVLALPSRRLRIVVLETTKGKGVSFMENRMEWHYLPLKEPHYTLALEELGLT
ncbi:transketolase [Dyella sp. EPa41]|uniref:transketolase n=1 Tax=Dyella sp. EPa41 TaxID=1561194 RepID=UPI00191538F1|nr:transketolase [Dyella sp. EPa41]